ncbi:ATP-binding cassette domain-containing protein [Virgibacillus halodenitrificans]|uniref:ABC transporter ATP-binding protein n=1 Tax=Virgibacillus halodenitrificans TaxID=1482 RepID=UPI0007621725|nr:ABC transporter ATP-binding protein [Virgibacillus halodenitrificans]MCG1028597.1 ABC transporter ATP-binding protein [Virgibacillus halodenitrificans]MCJ0931992.1 ABC transporter ATP-binding protein/permease [Virgibacillus halodenitrificans]MYL44219.1 ATP-binding cassette domain-containing protein [Virgibacillus halodenitrificans]
MRNNSFTRPFQYKRIPLEKLSKEKKRKANDAKGTIKRITSYLMREKAKLAFVILMVVLSSGLSLLGPFMIGMAIDDFIVTKQTAGLGMLLVWLIVIYLFHSLSIFLQNYWMVGIAQNTVYSLRKDLFYQFHRLPISYFDKRQHGELMSRITNDIDNVNNTLNQSVIQIFSSVLTLVGTIGVMLYLSPILTVVTMSIIPLMFLGMRWITKRTGPLYKLQQKDLGEVNGYVEEIVSGQLIVKAFSQEERVIGEFEERNSNLNRSGFWALTISGFIPKVMNMLNFLSFGLIALVGGILAIKGFITVGVIVIFTEYARQFTRPLNELSNQFNILLSAIAGAERVFQVIDEPQEEADEDSAIELNTTNGHIIFDHVSFGYEEDAILKDISFEAKPGETVAFVGHTGAGKTTIINLISRFYNYDEGKITLDGNDLKDIKRSNLRKHMAFVLQDSFLFHATIMENIRYGRLEATDQEVIQAAKDANAHDFIEKLPDGYNTILDQTGSGISQGQKQLLTIARALLAEPAILVLDEATSNIDTITELKIQEALTYLMEGRTSFVVAHRLNTIQEADKIIMLEHGKIIEAGSHDELLAQKGNYYQLYQGQLLEKAN